MAEIRENIHIYKLVNDYCWVGTCPRSVWNYRPHTDLFACTVCRFAVGGDMSPPYRGNCSWFLFTVHLNPFCKFGAEKVYGADCFFEGVAGGTDF